MDGWWMDGNGWMFLRCGSVGATVCCICEWHWVGSCSMDLCFVALILLTSDAPCLSCVRRRFIPISSAASHQFTLLFPPQGVSEPQCCFFFKKIFLITFSSGLVWVMLRTVLIWKTPKISSIDQHLVTVVQRKAVLFSVSWPFEH